MRFRKLRIAWSASCGILCLLLMVLWVRSYRWADRLQWSIAGSKSVAVAIKRGRFYLLRYDAMHEPNVWKDGLFSSPVDDKQSFPMNGVRDKSRLGFEILREPPFFIPEVQVRVAGKLVSSWGSGVRSLNGSGVALPGWFLVVVLGLFALAPWPHWSKRFRLRTLLIAMTVVAAFFGILVWAIR